MWSFLYMIKNRLNHIPSAMDCVHFFPKKVQFLTICIVPNEKRGAQA